MRWRYLVVSSALLAGLLLLLIRFGSGSANELSGDGGAMALDCNASVIGVQSKCAYPVGAEFSVEVYVLRAPTEGYVGFQTKVWWQSENVQYRPAANLWQEGSWPHCSVPARSINSPEPSVLFGCMPLPLPVEPYQERGLVLHFQFECLTESYNEIELLQRYGDSQLGTHFVDAAALEPIDPVLMNASVACGNAATPTACASDGCPTRTSTPTQTREPMPTPLPELDVAMAADCSPDTLRTHGDALLTCSASIMNKEKRALTDVHLTLWPWSTVSRTYFTPIGLTVDGQAVPVSQQRDFALGDLESGEAMEVVFRFAVSVPPQEGNYAEELTLMSTEGYGGRVFLWFGGSSDADYPPTGLLMSRVSLTENMTEDFHVPPPASREYEVIVANRADSVADVTLVTRYSEEIRPVSANPPSTGADSRFHTLTWDISGLQPGEERRVRIAFASLDNCSFVIQDEWAIAQRGEVQEEYVLESYETYDGDNVVGSDWECVLGFTDAPDSTPGDDTDGVGGRDDPEDPVPMATPTPTTAPSSAETPPDRDDVEPDAPVGPTEASGDSQVSALDGQSPAHGESGPLTSAPAAQPVALPETGTGGSGRGDGAALVWALLAGAGAVALGLGLLYRRST